MVSTNVNAISGADGHQEQALAHADLATAGTVGSTAGFDGFQAILSQQQPDRASSSAGVIRYAGQDLVDAAILAQALAQAIAGGGANPMIAGPAGYGRGAALDYVAQMQNVIANQSYLPNATGPGLTVLPGTPRNPAPQSTIDDYTRLSNDLTAKWSFTPDEISAAGQRLTANLESGISLDPGTSAAISLERLAQGVSAAQFAATASSPSVSAATSGGAAISAGTLGAAITASDVKATTGTNRATKAKAPTAAELAAIKARAVAAGHRPTRRQVLATYYRYA